MTPQKKLRRNPPRRCNMPPIHFDELIIVEILSWLPVKSLLRFRCVCKSWQSLISDPQFVKFHLHRSATNADFTNVRLLTQAIGNDGNRRRVLSYSVSSLTDKSSSTIAQGLCYPMKKAYGYYWVVGSCNGLLCLVNREIYKQYGVRLWNPSTRLISQKLPGFHIKWRCRWVCFGFGYDHLSDTYKVVVVLDDRSPNDDLEKSLVKVWSMGGNCWRNIQSFPVVPLNDGQFLSGTLNWVAVRNTSFLYSWKTVTIDQLVIVSIDLGMETCRQLLLPHGLNEIPNVAPTLGVLRECLCVSYDYKTANFLVWQMKEFGVVNSWTQLLNVSYLELPDSYLGLGCTLLPVCMSEAGNVLIVSTFAESRAIIYNSRDNRVELSAILKNMRWEVPKVFVESMVLPC